MTYPGCKHGTCNKPWECNCDKDWTGTLCQKPKVDLYTNRWTTNQPVPTNTPLTIATTSVILDKISKPIITNEKDDITPNLENKETNNHSDIDDDLGESMIKDLALEKAKNDMKINETESEKTTEDNKDQPDILPTETLTTDDKMTFPPSSLEGDGSNNEILMNANMTNTSN